MPERHRELEDYWNESQGNRIQGAHASDGWITEFSQNRERYDNPDAWANSFEQQHGANGWASEFEHVRSLHCSICSYNFNSLCHIYLHTSIILNLSITCNSNPLSLLRKLVMLN